jgi:anti-sigma factor RsiW
MRTNGHPGDLLSALLDGELDGPEAARVRDHVAACEACRAELDAVGAARTWVRELPPVEPPFGFYERMTRPLRRWARAGIAALAAGAAASIAVVAMSAPGERPVAPPVGRLVDAHTVSASTSGDPVSELTPAATPASFDK